MKESSQDDEEGRKGGEIRKEMGVKAMGALRNCSHCGEDGISLVCETHWFQVALF